MNIRDIAKAAEVSVSTVSKVINGKDKDISDATRQKVLKIIREYQYTPYSNIKDTVTQAKEHLIALVITSTQYLRPGFLSQVEQTAAKNGFSLLLCNIDTTAPAEVENRLKIVLAKRVSGVILCTHDRLLLDNAVRVLQNTPIVAVTSFRSVSVSTVRCDYTAAATDAIAQFASSGHQRIGCLLDDSDASIYEQIRNGIISGMGSHAIVANNHNILVSHSEESMPETELQNLLNRNLTAIYCQSQRQVQHLYEYLLRNNISIPQSLSLICGIRHSDHNSLPLTSYTIPYGDLASRAVFLLIDNITNRGIAAVQDVRLPLKFAKRNSISAPSGSSAPILVLGNCAYDTILSVAALPGNHQLQTSSNITTSPGGKCVAMSIAVARLGGSPHALGKIGNDAEGRSVLSALIENGVHAEGIVVDNVAITGRSYLTATENGDYTIIAHSGANRLLGIQSIKNVQKIMPSAAACLISTEVPFPVVKHLIQKCVVHKTAVFLKPSVPIPLESTLLRHIDYFIPNEAELDQLIPGPQSMEEKAEQLFRLGCPNIIVTMANNGCYVRNAEYALYIPAASFSPIETASAANCFIAALAVMLSQGTNFLYSLCYATYAAGISISQIGMFTSFPFRQQMDLYLDEINNFYLNLLETNHLPSHLQ